MSYTAEPPRWFRIVAGLAIVWMLVGVATWMMDFITDEATVAGLTEGQRQLYAIRPQWLFAVYGIATFAGLAGAILLFMRRASAVAAFAVSLAAVVVQFGYTFVFMDAIGLLGAAQAVPFPLTILAIGAALLWFSMHATRQGWLTGGAAAPASATAA
jgi:hypothetical protein